MKRFWLSMTITLLIIANGQAGGEKEENWKPFLSGEAYKELTLRSIKAIEAAAKSDDTNAAGKAHVEAVILAGYTLAVADAKKEDVSMLRGAAQFADR